jgi:hypothetical protein
VSDRTLIVPPELQAGKAAAKALIRAFGGQIAAAAELGKSQSRMCDYGSPHTGDFMPISDVLTLEGRTHGQPGHPHVTRWLARQAGYGLVRLPDPDAPETVWSALIARLAREYGELAGGVLDDLSSGNDVAPAEARRRLADAADLVRVAVELEGALKIRSQERAG